MATLSVMKFDDPGGADEALVVLRRLQQQQLIEVLDAAVVSWPKHRRGLETRQAHDTTSAGALGRAFRGFLLGVIFFAPLLGLAVGAATGAVSGSLADVGIDDMAEGAVADRVVPELKRLNPELITTNLPKEQESRLRDLFTAS